MPQDEALCDKSLALMEAFAPFLENVIHDNGGGLFWPAAVCANVLSKALLLQLVPK